MHAAIIPIGTVNCCAYISMLNINCWVKTTIYLCIYIDIHSALLWRMCKMCMLTWHIQNMDISRIKYTYPNMSPPVENTVPVCRGLKLCMEGLLKGNIGSCPEATTLRYKDGMVCYLLVGIHRTWQVGGSLQEGGWYCRWYSAYKLEIVQSSLKNPLQRLVQRKVG